MIRTMITSTEVDPKTGGGKWNTTTSTMLESTGCLVTGCYGSYTTVTTLQGQRRVATGHNHWTNL